MSVGEFLEHCAGIGFLVLVLHGCGSITQWADQCSDGKWRGFEHANRCAAYLAESR